MRRTNQDQSIKQYRLASAKDSIRLGHRWKPSRSIDITRISTDLQADLARFWEIDEGPPTTHLSEAERQCEEHFRNHVRLRLSQNH